MPNKFAILVGFILWQALAQTGLRKAIAWVPMWRAS